MSPGRYSYALPRTVTELVRAYLKEAPKELRPDDEPTGVETPTALAASTKKPRSGEYARADVRDAVRIAKVGR